jgi:hypothetical protein
VSSKYNHSRKRTLPARVIKLAKPSNIDPVMIDVWAEQNPAREEKIWQKKMYKPW